MSAFTLLLRFIISFYCHKYCLLFVFLLVHCTTHYFIDSSVSNKLFQNLLVHIFLFTYLLIIPIYSQGTVLRCSQRTTLKRFSMVRSPQRNPLRRPALDIQRTNSSSYAPMASLNLHETDHFSTEISRNTFTISALKTRSDGSVVGHCESRRS